MRILLVYLEAWPMFIRFVSGGERHFIEVCKRWVSHGHEIHVLTTKVGAQNLRLNDLFVETHVVNVPFEEALCQTSLGVAVFYSLRVLMAFVLWLKSLSRKNFDIVCASTCFICDVLPAVFISRRGNSKIVVYVHELTLPPRLRARYQSFMPSFLLWSTEQLTLKLVKRFAHMIFALSVARERLISMGIPNRCVKATNNGIDFVHIQQVDPTDDKYEACFLGRISPSKGVIDLIGIWNEVLKEIPKARIAVIGGSGEKDYISRFVNEVKSADLEDNIVYLGAVDEDRKYALLKSSRIFVFPSYEEGWGITICEAMACGLPVVAYGLPVYKYVFKLGMVTVAVGNKEQFADAIMQLFQNSDFALKLSEEAKLQAMEYNWDNIAHNEMKSLEELVSVSGSQ